VGAVIDILGRPTTLRKASLEVQEWIDARAKVLHANRAALVVRLSFLPLFLFFCVCLRCCCVVLV